MEFIMELLIEIILEGTVEVSMTKSKKVPIVLRFLAGLIVGVLFGGIFIGLLYAGINNRSPLMIGIAILFLILTMVFFIKTYRTVNKKKSDGD